MLFGVHGEGEGGDQSAAAAGEHGMSGDERRGAGSGHSGPQKRRWVTQMGLDCCTESELEHADATCEDRTRRRRREERHS